MPSQMVESDIDPPASSIFLRPHATELNMELELCEVIVFVIESKWAGVLY